MRPLALLLVALVAACGSVTTLPLERAVPPGTASFALDPIPTPVEARLEDRLLRIEPGRLETELVLDPGLGPPESFTLTVGADGGKVRVRIASADEEGRRWAERTLRQLTVRREGETWIRAGAVRDRPAFPYRGSKRPLPWEDLYRANFSHENRGGRRHFVAVLSPGGVLDATERGIADAERFFAAESAKGARLFAVEFDDVGFGLTEETRDRFGTYPVALVHYLRACREALRRIDPGAVLYWLPQTYWTRDPRLPALAREIGLAGGLPEDLGLVLTGPQVISSEIPAEEIAGARRAFGLTRTKALVYDNLGREGDHGPLRGRDARLVEEADAVFGERGEVLNRITRLDYAWNPAAYQPTRSHLLACREVAGPAAAPFLSELVLEWPRLTPLRRLHLYRAALARLDPPAGAPADARALLRRIWRGPGKRPDVDMGSESH